MTRKNTRNDRYPFHPLTVDEVSSTALANKEITWDKNLGYKDRYKKVGWYVLHTSHFSTIPTLVNDVKKIFVFLFTTQFKQYAICQGSGQHRSAGATTNTKTTLTMIVTGEYGALEAHARPNLMHRQVRLIGDNSPSKLIYSWGGLIGPMAFKVLLYSGNDVSPQHWSILRAIHPLNPYKKLIRLLVGLFPNDQTCWHRLKGLQWDARGPFPLAAVMVVMVVLPLGLTLSHCFYSYIYGV
jgi:hypothetical protein